VRRGPRGAAGAARRCGDRGRSDDQRLALVPAGNLQVRPPLVLRIEDVDGRRLLGIDAMKLELPTAVQQRAFLLVHRGDLEEVEKGEHGKRRASRYRYLGD